MIDIVNGTFEFFVDVKCITRCYVDEYIGFVSLLLRKHRVEDHDEEEEKGQDGVSRQRSGGSEKIMLQK